MLHAESTSITTRLARAGKWAQRRRWLLTGVVAMVCAITVVARIGAADRARDAWGTRRAVTIATHDLVPGMTVTASDVSIEQRPIAVIPADIAESPVGRVVAESIASGEPVLDRRLAGAARRMPGALADGAVFAVPIEHSALSVSVGDRVDAWSPGSTRSTTAQRVARRARVVSLSDRSVSIAVSSSDAEATARAILDGAVLLALSAAQE